MKEEILLQRPKDVNWHKCNTSLFWDQIAPVDHIVQMYESDEILLATLEGFVKTGIEGGESVIIIATKSHRDALNERLINAGLDLDTLIAKNQYIPLDAEKCLSKFMVHGWPSDHLFHRFVREAIAKAKGPSNRKVRAYGEMVAILWGKGHAGATIQLEHLWNSFAATEDFCLFCAYPQSDFENDGGTSGQHICSSHSKIIAGDVASSTNIFYKSS